MNSSTPTGSTIYIPQWIQKTKLFDAIEVTVPLTAPKYPYKLARLVHYNYNLKKRWYVDYHAFHIRKQKLVRVRQYDPINRRHTVAERLEIGKELVTLINGQLMSGKVLGKSKENGQSSKDLLLDTSHYQVQNLNILEALQYFINQKKLDRLRPRTLRRYQVLINLWEYYFQHVDLPTAPMKEVDTQEASRFFHYLQTVRKVSNKTFNNYRGDMNTFFIWCMKKGRLKENPFSDIVSLRVITRKHTSYSDEQMSAIKQKCIELKETDLLLYIQFLFYTLIRPGELLQLRIHHIRYKENKILVPGTISKNRYDEFVPIAKALRVAIDQAGIMKWPADHYIIGGESPIAQNTLYKHNKKILQALKLTGKDHTVYSYKHSGAISLYRATKDVVLIQQMCRHRSLQETQTYLKDLGQHLDYDNMLKGWTDDF